MKESDRDPQGREPQSKETAELEPLLDLAREKGYLTNEDIRDHLRFLGEEHVEQEDVEDYIQRLDSRGVTTIFDDMPSLDSMMLIEGETDPMVTDEIVEEAASISTSPAVSEEKITTGAGSTADPVRLYMREMGNVQLLTRQGEINIAKRIEEGVREVLMTLAQYPPLLNPIAEEFARFEKGEIKVNDFINGFVDITQVPATVIPEELPTPMMTDEAVPMVEESEEETVTDATTEGGFEAEPDTEETKRRFEELFRLMAEAERAVSKKGRKHNTA